MEPSKKAKELVEKFINIETHNVKLILKQEAKKGALIVVNEIINECGDRFLFSKCDYWQQVKQEIENL